MADATIPHFHNSDGVETIRVGSRHLTCIGALPPLDHPHVFLQMGSDTETVCPYCSTRYIYDPSLKATESDPASCSWIEED